MITTDYTSGKAGHRKRTAVGILETIGRIQDENPVLYKSEKYKEVESFVLNSGLKEILKETKNQFSKELLFSMFPIMDIAVKGKIISKISISELAKFSISGNLESTIDLFIEVIKHNFRCATYVS